MQLSALSPAATQKPEGQRAGQCHNYHFLQQQQQQPPQPPQQQQVAAAAAAGPMDCRNPYEQVYGPSFARQLGVPLQPPFPVVQQKPGPFLPHSQHQNPSSQLSGATPVVSPALGSVPAQLGSTGAVPSVPDEPVFKRPEKQLVTAVNAQAQSGSDESSSSLAEVQGCRDGPPAKRQRFDAGQPWQAHSQPAALLAGQPPLEGPAHSDSAGPVGRPQQHKLGGPSKEVKEAAAKQIKVLLKPLLEQKQIDRSQFKGAARAATHSLAKHGIFDAQRAAQALGEVLCQMDLPDAAKCVLVLDK
jgi:hypothetical protein